MDRAELQALQAPLKEHYREEPEAALITLRADGTLDEERFSRFFRDFLMSSGRYVSPKDTFPDFEARDLILIGFIVGVGGQLGDLAISVIKRDL